MRTAVIGFAGGIVLSTVGASLVAAPEQGPRPGDMSPANVWVQNRGSAEAIPVALEDRGAPLRVTVAGISTTRVEGVVSTTAGRQIWEYSQIRVGANQDAVALLNTAGAAGWETTGIELVSGGTMTVILKRPR